MNLSGARAAPSLYPAEQLRQAAIRAMRRHPDMLVRATPPGGNQAFRSALARRALESGMVLAAEDITVTHGCIEALNLALRAVAQPGDTIAVESPGFLRFAPDPGKPRPAGARNTDQRDHRAIGRGVGTRIACLRQHQGGGRRAASAEPLGSRRLRSTGSGNSFATCCASRRKSHEFAYTIGSFSMSTTLRMMRWRDFV